MENKENGNANISGLQKTVPSQAESEYTIYVPEFRDQMIDEAVDDETTKEVHNKFMGMDWITGNLCKEISDGAPKIQDIDQGTGKRKLESFKNRCLLLSPSEEYFAQPYKFNK